jgi:signal transduction histidine kinase
LTKRLVEAHGGRIWFESKKGAGTTFTFTLQPAATQHGGDPE